MSDAMSNVIRDIHSYHRKPFAEWDDADRAHYLAADFDSNGLEVDDDPWVVPFLVRALRSFASLNATPAPAVPVPQE